MATTDPFTASIILPFPECHLVEIIQYVAFTARLLSLSNMHLSLVAQLVKNLPTMQGTQVRFLSWEDLLEKEMATHSSTPAWGLPWTEEPGRLQSMRSQRVGKTERLHFLPFPDSSVGKKPACQCRRLGFSPWVGKISWRRKWQPTAIFLPGKSHGQRSLAGYSPWVCKRVGQDLETKQQQQQKFRQGI